MKRLPELLKILREYRESTNEVPCKYLLAWMAREGLDYAWEDIAETFSLPIETVRSWVHDVDDQIALKEQFGASYTILLAVQRTIIYNESNQRFCENCTQLILETSTPASSSGDFPLLPGILEQLNLWNR